MDRMAEITADLHRLVPLAAAMGARVSALERARLTLTAPFAGNTNHAGTAFGGGLYCLAVLAGWAWLRERGYEAGVDVEIVIAEATVQYRRPVTDTLEATVAVTPEELQATLDALARPGRPSLPLTIQLCGNAAKVTARFVALPLGHD